MTDHTQPPDYDNKAPDRIWLGCMTDDFEGCHVTMDGWSVHYVLETGSWLEGPHEYTRSDIVKLHLDAVKAEAIANIQIELDRTRELLNQKSANNRTLARNLRARKDKIENAIDRARTQGRAEGMQVAAGIVSWRASETDSPNAAFELSAALNVIRAAIMKGGAE